MSRRHGPQPPLTPEGQESLASVNELPRPPKSHRFREWLSTHSHWTQPIIATLIVLGGGAAVYRVTHNSNRETHALAADIPKYLRNDLKDQFNETALIFDVSLYTQGNYAAAHDMTCFITQENIERLPDIPNDNNEYKPNGELSSLAVQVITLNEDGVGKDYEKPQDVTFVCGPAQGKKPTATALNVNASFTARTVGAAYAFQRAERNYQHYAVPAEQVINDNQENELIVGLLGAAVMGTGVALGVTDFYRRKYM